MSMVNHNGVRIHYHVEGVGSPLVLYHGMRDSLVSWQDYGYTEPLKKKYQLVLIDSRGHGASDKPHDPGAYTLPLRVADVVAVLDDLGIGAAHYLGYSLGDWIGFGMAKYAPERLKSLIIGGAQPYGHSFATFRQILRGGIKAWVAAAEQMAGPLPSERRQRLLDNDAQALLASITQTFLILLKCSHRSRSLACCLLEKQTRFAAWRSNAPATCPMQRLYLYPA
jgi:pimeloyl-ACP methyl ester carboxylesterase